MKAPYFKVTHFNSEEASFVLGTPDERKQETNLIVSVEYKGYPLQFVFKRDYRANSKWTVNEVWCDGVLYSVEQLFQTDEFSYLRANMLQQIYPTLMEVEKKEDEAYRYAAEFQKERSQQPVEDPLIRKGTELTRKIAIKGQWRVGFDLKQDTGEFIFILADYQIPQGSPAMVIGLAEIMYKFNNEDEFVDDAVRTFSLLLNQIV